MSAQFTLTRRDVLLSLPAIAVARKAFAQSGGATLRARGLSQMTLSVSDVKRSLDFYQGLFGMPIQARQGETLILRIGSGPHYIALTPAGASVPSISRLGLALEDFNVDRVLKVLAEHGITRADGRAADWRAGR